MDLIARALIATVLTMSVTLTAAQTPPSPATSSAATKLANPTQLSPEAQFMRDVQAGANISQREKSRAERLNLTPGNPYRDNALKSDPLNPWSAYTDKDVTRLTAPSSPTTARVLEGTPAPATPLDPLTFGDGNAAAGIEVGVGLTTNYGTHNLTVTPYYKRTPKRDADSLKELYSSQNSEQEVGIHIRSTF